MIKEKLSGINPFRVFLLTSLIVSIAMLIQWDRHRVNTDFDSVMSLLNSTWIDAGVNGKQLIVRFNADSITVTDGGSGNVITALKIPTLHKVDYDTTLGDDTIVFTGVGTSIHNKREHGGALTLRSWFGFKKYIAVNCNGMVTEGRYPG